MNFGLITSDLDYILMLLDYPRGTGVTVFLYKSCTSIFLFCKEMMYTMLPWFKRLEENLNLQHELNKMNEPIIYIGKAEKSLIKRLSQELRGKSHGTFFRSLGAILNYEPQRGSLKNMKNKINYKFSKDDQEEIIIWINRHLEINWIKCLENIITIEKELINKYRPLLNIESNPNASQLVKNKRKKCREIARG